MSKTRPIKLQRNIIACAISAIGFGASYAIFGSPESFIRKSVNVARELNEAAFEKEAEKNIAAGASVDEAWREMSLARLAIDARDAASALQAAARRQTEAEAQISLLGAAGEFIVASNEGAVTAEAKAIFDKIRLIKPNESGALYYLGLAADQHGDIEDRNRLWSMFLVVAGSDHPLFETIRNRIGGSRISNMTVAPSGLSTEAGLSEYVRERGRAMTERLQERLMRSDGELDDWLLLARSYRRLGDLVKAEEAYSAASSRFPGDRRLLLEQKAFLKELR